MVDLSTASKILQFALSPAGLDVCEQFMDVNDMIKDEDLMVQKLHPHENALDHRIYASASGHNIQRLVANMVPSAKRPSARQLNLLKRKAKINSKDQMKLWVEDGEIEMSHTRNITTPKGMGPDSPNLVKVTKIILASMNFNPVHHSPFLVDIMIQVCAACVSKRKMYFLCIFSFKLF